MSGGLDGLLRRRWGLPPEAAAAVLALEGAWQEGHSAWPVEGTEAGAWASCPAVAPGLDGAPRPLVLHRGLLQSWRHASAERELARRLTALALRRPPHPPAAAAGALAALYPHPGDAQARAVRLGLDRCLALIVGGPGTGKTHTAARLLALLLEADPDLRFALAAPTGKAAQRLGQSVAQAAGDPALRRVLPAGAARLAAAAARVQTLHRLLEWRPGADRCGRDAARPLDLGVLVLDEAGMLDLLQWRALMRALPEQARLVALGDPAQLESVEPGRVLGDLVDAAPGGPLAACLAELGRNYRFEDRPGIAALARAARDRDAEALLRAALPGASGEVRRHGADTRGVDAALEGLWPAIRALALAADAPAAVEALEAVRILCGVNRGAWGVEGLNERVDRRLAGEGVTHPCRPVLVTANDPRSGLFNGDLGVMLGGEESGWAVFPGPEGLRRFAVAALPEHLEAWAMTVHRSQGSEYRTVAVFLPPQPAEWMNPQWLYTAVTRAKEGVVLAATDEALARCCRTGRKRCSGLGAWLE